MSKNTKADLKRGFITLTLILIGVFTILFGMINGKIIVTISGVVMILFGFFFGLENRAFNSMLNSLPPSPGA